MDTDTGSWLAAATATASDRWADMKGQFTDWWLDNSDSDKDRTETLDDVDVGEKWRLDSDVTDSHRINSAVWRDLIIKLEGEKNGCCQSSSSVILFTSFLIDYCACGLTAWRLLLNHEKEFYSINLFLLSSRQKINTTVPSGLLNMKQAAS